MAGNRESIRFFAFALIALGLAFYLLYSKVESLEQRIDDLQAEIQKQE